MQKLEAIMERKPAQERKEIMHELKQNYRLSSYRTFVKETYLNVNGEHVSRVFTIGPFLGKGGFARVY